VRSSWLGRGPGDGDGGEERAGEDEEVVRRERLHERSSAMDGREGEEERAEVEAEVCRRTDVGAAVGWVEDGRPGRQAARYTSSTDVEVERERDSK
jgi:hypothetical protein